MLMRYPLLAPLFAKPVRIIAVLAMAIALSSGLAVATAPAGSAAVRSLATPAGLPVAIEPLASYVEQISCQPGYRTGTLALARLLVTTYPNTSYGGAYACGMDGNRSEHYDGRAVDWMNSVRNPVQAAQAAAVIKFLLASDKYGNKFANARRMGIMYIIWNNKMWGSWDGTWSDYNNCATTPSTSMDNACHRNHMHISLSWNGAKGRTSFWSKRAFAATDYGPCRTREFNWSANYVSYNPQRCPSYPLATAPAGSSAVMKSLVAFSGASIYPGMSGKPVVAVQQALRVPATGRYDSITVAAVQRFKQAHGMRPTSPIGYGTWRTLLAAFKPKS
jgi:hypothetical protein